MNRSIFAFFFAIAAILVLSSFGCSGKEKEVSELQSGDFLQEGMVTKEPVQQIPAPVQPVAQEVITVTPAVAPQIETQSATFSLEGPDRTKGIQSALKNAGFYTGTIDGIIGPQTKRAVEQFQEAKGLKVDGIVGSQTLAELQKYLTQ